MTGLAALTWPLECAFPVFEKVRHDFPDSSAQAPHLSGSLLSPNTQHGFILWLVLSKYSCEAGSSGQTGHLTWLFLAPPPR